MEHIAAQFWKALKLTVALAAVMALGLAIGALVAGMFSADSVIAVRFGYVCAILSGTAFLFRNRKTLSE